MGTGSNSQRNEPSHEDRHRAERRTSSFLLVREAAEIMRMDDSTLYRHLRGGRFPAVKVGGRYLVPVAAVEQMAEEAVVSGQCIVVEEWAVRWREERAAEALARGLTHAPPSRIERRVDPGREARLPGPAGPGVAL